MKREPCNRANVRLAGRLLLIPVMVGLLAIVASGLLLGKLASRMTFTIDVILLLLVGAFVIADYASWTATSESVGDHLVHWLLSGVR